MARKPAPPAPPVAPPPATQEAPAKKGFLCFGKKQKAPPAPKPEKTGCFGGKKKSAKADGFSNITQPQPAPARVPAPAPAPAKPAAKPAAAPTPAAAPAPPAPARSSSNAATAAAAAASAPAEVQPATLQPAASLKGAAAPQRLMRVTLKTGTKPKAGTDADISLILVGSNCRTPELILSGKGNLFEAGKTDVFTVDTVADIGNLLKADIGFSKKWSASGLLANVFADAWYWESMEVLDLTSGQKSVFQYNEWINKEKPRCELAPISQEIVEVPKAEAGSSAAMQVRSLSTIEAAAALAASTGPDPATMVAPVQIQVKTGSVPYASTTADISIVLVGSNGATKELTLSNKRTNFAQGQTDGFLVDAGLAYGKLASISIGYASKRTVSSNVLGNFTLDAWFLESVEVQDIKTGEKSVFTYNNWINKDKPRVSLSPVEQDKVGLVTSFSLQAATAIAKQRSLTVGHHHTVTVTVVTGDAPAAGTNADISVVLIGDQAITQELRLFRKGHSSFQRAASDIFTVDAGIVYGSLQRISIGYSHKGSLFGTLGDAWLLDSVEVFDHITGQKSKFAINQWVNKDKPRVEVAPASQEGTKPEQPAEQPPAAAAAGSRSRRATSATRTRSPLRTSPSQRPGSATAGQAAAPLAPLPKSPKMASLGIKPTGKFTRYSTSPTRTGVAPLAVPPSPATAAAGQLAKQMNKLNMRTASGGPPAPTYTSLALKKAPGSTKGNAGPADPAPWAEAAGKPPAGKPVPKIDPPTEPAAGDAAAASNGASNGGAASEPSAQRSLATSASHKGVFYNLRVVTGDKMGAGTDADISVVLIGELGSSSELMLTGKKNLFERNQVDTFTVEVPQSLGTIKALNIGYATRESMSGAIGKVFGAEWMLSTVSLVDTVSGKHYAFVYDGWIDATRPRVNLTPMGAGDAPASGSA